MGQSTKGGSSATGRVSPSVVPGISECGIIPSRSSRSLQAFLESRPFGAGAWNWGSRTRAVRAFVLVPSRAAVASGPPNGRMMRSGNWRHTLCGMMFRGDFNHRLVKLAVARDDTCRFQWQCIPPRIANFSAGFFHKKTTCRKVPG